MSPVLDGLPDALAAGRPFRADLPGGGSVFVDSAVPLLVVHRCRASSDAHPAEDIHAACSEAHDLATVAPAYVVDTSAGTDTPALVRSLVSTIEASGSAVLVVELWTPFEAADESPDPFDRRPGFTVYAPSAAHGPACDAAEALCDALSGIEIAGQGAEVSQVAVETPGPPGHAPLLGAPTERVAVLGLAADAVYLNARDGEFYPGVLAAMRTALAPALDRAAWTFACASGTEAPERAAWIGRRHLEPAADAVDRGLAACSQAFGFLLQVTPVNGAAAWQEFKAGGGPPELLYRPLTFDPDTVRRELFALPLEHVEDPVVASLLRERRDETAAKIQLILDIETPSFLPGSVALYGAPDADLLALAHRLIAAMPEASTRGTERVGATVFAAEARAEVEHFQAQWDGVDARVEIRQDMPGSLMVSSGQLLVGGRASIPADRVRALLAHEVGTHVLTYYNGKAQPLRLLQHGLADYEGLQEGIAVLSEWLVGGLNAGRFRTLAARVIGADALAGGAAFPETVHVLRDAAGLKPRAAFNVALRLHRGGGLTKDLVYLRGLRDLLAYLGDGGAFWPLMAGKMGLHHVEAVESLTRRGILRDARIRPRWSEDPAALARLDRTREGLSVLDLLS